MHIQDLAQNNFIQDAIDREAIKVGRMPIIRTPYLVMVLHQKLPI